MNINIAGVHESDTYMYICTLLPPDQRHSLAAYICPDTMCSSRFINIYEWWWWMLHWRVIFLASLSRLLLFQPCANGHVCLCVLAYLCVSKCASYSEHIGKLHTHTHVQHEQHFAWPTVGKHLLVYFTHTHTCPAIGLGMPVG